eukprot:363309-Chlamydomonas_euryale.AAC.46
MGKPCTSMACESRHMARQNEMARKRTGGGGVMLNSSWAGAWRQRGGRYGSVTASSPAATTLVVRDCGACLPWSVKIRLPTRFMIASELWQRSKDA